MNPLRHKPLPYKLVEIWNIQGESVSRPPSKVYDSQVVWPPPEKSCSRSCARCTTAYLSIVTSPAAISSRCAKKTYTVPLLLKWNAGRAKKRRRQPTTRTLPGSRHPRRFGYDKYDGVRTHPPSNMSTTVSEAP